MGEDSFLFVVVVFGVMRVGGRVGFHNVSKTSLCLSPVTFFIHLIKRLY